MANLEWLHRFIVVNMEGNEVWINCKLCDWCLHTTTDSDPRTHAKGASHHLKTLHRAIVEANRV